MRFWIWMRFIEFRRFTSLVRPKKWLLIQKFWIIAQHRPLARWRLKRAWMIESDHPKKQHEEPFKLLFGENSRRWLLLEEFATQSSSGNFCKYCSLERFVPDSIEWFNLNLWCSNKLPNNEKRYLLLIGNHQVSNRSHRWTLRTNQTDHRFIEIDFDPFSDLEHTWIELTR